MNIHPDRYILKDIQRLECETASGKKFWNGAVAFDKAPNAGTDSRGYGPKQWVVFLEWGRAGQNGHKETKLFTTESGAVSYFEGRLRDKAKKGYKSLIDTEFVPEAKIMKAVETDWDIL